MWLGSKLEPVVAELYTRKTGEQIKRADFLAVKDGAEFASATPDYVKLDESAPVEIKTCGVKSMAKWDGIVPDTAHAQLIWQMGICAWPVGTICCLPANSPERFICKEFPFNTALFDFMLERAAEFMELVKSDTPPPAQVQDAEVLAARALQRRAKGEARVFKEVPHEGQMILLLNTYQQATSTISQYNVRIKNEKEKLELTQAIFLQEMGETYNALRIGGFELSADKVERKGYEVKPAQWLKWNFKEVTE
jgi:predicted phage-related endonuclease